jgi:hypothetical protein
VAKEFQFNSCYIQSHLTRQEACMNTFLHIISATFLNNANYARMEIATDGMENVSCATNLRISTNFITNYHLLVLFCPSTQLKKIIWLIISDFSNTWNRLPFLQLAKENEGRTIYISTW